MFFVTGATGLVGSFICRELLRQGFNIRAVKRSGSEMNLVSDIAHQIEWVEGDIRDMLWLRKNLKDVVRVLHCAAVVSYNQKDKELMHSVNVTGTSNLINACIDKGIEKLLYVSSIATIGKKKNSYSSDENSNWNYTELGSHYARTKYLAELEVWRGVAEGLSSIIINPSVVIGPGNWDKSSTKLLKYVWEESQFYLEGLINVVDVRDAANIAVKLLNSEENNERFIINAGAISYKDFFEKIADNFNKKPPRVKLNKIQLQTAIWFANFGSWILNKRTNLSSELPKLVNNRYTYSNNKIKKVLNYKFRPISQTLEWACQEIMKNINK